MLDSVEKVDGYQLRDPTMAQMIQTAFPIYGTRGFSLSIVIVMGFLINQSLML